MLMELGNDAGALNNGIPPTRRKHFVRGVDRPGILVKENRS